MNESVVPVHHMILKVFIVLVLLLVNIVCVNDKPNYAKELMDAYKTTLKITPLFIENISKKYDRNQLLNGTDFEDMHLDIMGLINKYGYPVEQHEVITEDGYILKLFRIPSFGQPIFLMHGLVMSADDWVTSGPASGLAYLLADKGYDVWIGNARGNKHSRRHISLSPDKQQFWDFTWSEIGSYDIPLMIDYVLNKTGAPQLTYICHSQGCTVFFVMVSEKPEYNNKIKLAVCLAPVAAVLKIKSPLLLFLSHLSQHQPEKLFELTRYIGFHEFFGKNVLVESFLKNVCGDIELARLICSNMVFIVCGFSYNQLNVTNLPVIYTHSPTGASTKQLEHFAQTLSARKFQKYDHGKKKNLKFYGTKHPPEYRLESITVPVAIFHSEDDWLATEDTVNFIRSRIRNVVGVYKITETFNHIDFLHGIDMQTHIFPRLLNHITG